MAARKQQRLDDRLDLEQILLQAKHRWLRPAEICHVLQNHTSFCVSVADKPPSGALFLYDRNVIRSFRKDGYRWKKTKDGKAVKEAHERLQAGGVEALHCYYAHGEENGNFQRRCYWMIEKRLWHIVVVHYREVKTSEGKLSCSSKLSINWNMHSDTAYHASTSFPGGVNADELLNSLWPPCHMNLDKQNDSSVHRHSDKQNDPRILKNRDSSDQCMNTELGDLTELQMSSSRDHLSTIASENGNDGSGALQPVQIAIPGPSLFQDLLFNIIDLSPNWAYENSETEPTTQKCPQEKQIQHSERDDLEVEDLSTLPSLDPNSPIEQDHSNTVSAAVEDFSAEESILYGLQDIIAKLDIKTRLGIQDSLLRLAQNAVQRHHTSDTSSVNRNSKDEPEIVAKEEIGDCNRYTSMPDVETETNPIDVTVAHLLYDKFHTQVCI